MSTYMNIANTIYNKIYIDKWQQWHELVIGVGSKEKQLNKQFWIPANVDDAHTNLSKFLYINKLKGILNEVHHIKKAKPHVSRCLQLHLPVLLPL